jgi:hypothetical protein
MGHAEEREKLVRMIRQLQAQNKELAEENQDKNRPGAKGFGDYIARSQFYANVPRDPYAHQYMMVHKPAMDVSKPSDLLSPNVLLSNIKESRTMILLQRDFYYLHRFFDMGRRSDAVAMLFRGLYYPWEGQMRMTATLSGKERDLQSFLAPLEPMGGGGLSFLKKRPKTARRKKSLQDFLTPQEDESMYE